jgi:AcrR family transcriptional regulator
MVRWEPDAQGRLRLAAMALFAENGYEQTTVAQIAASAGVTERTFFRYFADKREVLFLGGHELETFLAGHVTAAPPAATPLTAIAGALAAAAAAFFTAEHQVRSRQRHLVISSSPDLQERELLKLASLAAAFAAALRERGVSDPGASLVAESGVAVFKTAFGRWVSGDASQGLADIIEETLAELRAVVCAS